MIVLLTDGRANVSLAKSNEEPDACAEGAPRPSQACEQPLVTDKCMVNLCVNDEGHGRCVNVSWNGLRLYAFQAWQGCVTCETP